MLKVDPAIAPLSSVCLFLFSRCVYSSGALCVCVVSALSAMPVTSQLLRVLPRAKVLASCLLPCQHQSQLGTLCHQPASRCQQHPRGYRTTSELRSYILTPPQVNSILKANEYSFKVCGVMLSYRLTFGFYTSVCLYFKASMLPPLCVMDEGAGV